MIKIVILLIHVIMMINTLYLVSLLSVIQNYARATAISRYYLLSRDIAISEHQKDLAARSADQDRERVMSFSEIDEQFVEQDFIMSTRHSCPSLSDFNTTAIKVCPTHRTLDIDVNRLPIAIYQVWEPVSYSCSCTKRRKRRIRYVSPP